MKIVYQSSVIDKDNDDYKKGFVDRQLRITEFKKKSKRNDSTN